jgi:hypothetical protein
VNPRELSPEKNEWLESDGLSGFASGTSAGLHRRRYRALLLPRQKLDGPSPLGN